jgi:hypothetical protein
MIIDSGVVTGSLQVSGSLTVTGSSSLQGNVSITGSLAVNGPISGAITGSITNAVSASYALNASTADSATSATSASRATSALNADVAVTASYVLSAVSASRAISAQAADNAVSSSYALFASQALSASHAVSANQATSAIGATSASRAITAANADNADLAANATLFNSLSSSQFPQLVLNNTFTGNNTFAGTQYISNTTDATAFTSTPALYTDGGFRVTKDTFLSGSVTVGGNFTVFGTASVNYVTTSVFVGLEYINLNTELPALRYAGINVGDSGSATGISSSFWYDSAKDNWLYVYAPAGSGQQTSSLAINGPITYNNVGSEQGLLGNYVVKSQLITADNNHHITSSQIFDDGTTVAIAGNLQVTGSFRAANLTGSLDGSNLVNATVANAKLTNSTISGIALGSNLGTLTISTGLSGTSYNGSTGVTIANTGVLSVTTNTGLSTNASATGNVTITNTGVTSNVAGTGISVSGATGAVTITNTGVTSAVAGTGVGVSGATGAVTISIGQAVATSSNVQFNSLGVGTAGSGTTGEIRATADITAFFSSDERLKENIARIEDPIAKIKAIDGVTFSWKGGFEEVHSHIGNDTGVIAQQIEAIGLPETVTTRENGFKAVKYEKLNALLIEGIKAQQAQIDFLQQQLEEVKAILNK